MSPRDDFLAPGGRSPALLTRREWLIRTGLVAAGSLLAATSTAQASGLKRGPALQVTPKRGGSVIWALEIDPVNVAPYGVPNTSNHLGKEFMYDSLMEWAVRTRVRWLVVDQGEAAIFRRELEPDRKSVV